jgi:type VI secretion system protein ImpG
VHLDFHLGWGNESSNRVHELLMTAARAFIVRWEGPRGDMQHAFDPALHRIEPLGFSKDEALLPVDPRSFDGYRLLHEYFSFPARFMFARFAGLKAAAAACDRSVMELVVPLAAEDEWLEDHPDLSKQFLLGCTPAINLFRPDSIDPVAVTPGRYEYRVVADAARQMDYEIFSIDKVLGSDRRTGALREFAPFYSSSDPRRGNTSLAGYFSTHRRLTSRSEFEVASGRDGGGYLGSDLSITLTDIDGQPSLPEVTFLSVDGLCTNRDLPLELWRTRGENAFEGGKSVAQCRIRCLRPPTTPRPAIAQGEAAWRLVSHLSLNFHPLLDAEGDGEVSADALRDLCRLFADRDAATGEVRGRRLETAARQADSIKSIRVRRVSGPLPRQSRLSIVRGIEIELTLDERAFHGASLFAFASVLEQFFARYVSINSFANTVLRTVQRGEVHRWPSRIGRRPTC